MPVRFARTRATDAPRIAHPARSDGWLGACTGPSLQDVVTDHGGIVEALTARDAAMDATSPATTRAVRGAPDGHRGVAADDHETTMWSSSAIG
jgi:hypothetical protein